MREDQVALEHSLRGHALELRGRMRRARDFHPNYLHTEVWRNPWFAQALSPVGHGFYRPPMAEDALLTRLRLDPMLGKPPLGFPGLHSPFRAPLRLDPFARYRLNPNEIFYVSPGGGLRLSEGELGGLGRVRSDEEWIQYLITRSPLEEAHSQGLAGGGPNRNSLLHFLSWLDRNLRRDNPDYVSACLDMYFGGVALRIGVLPRGIHSAGSATALEQAEAARVEGTRKVRQEMKREKEERKKKLPVQDVTAEFGTSSTMPASAVENPLVSSGSLAKLREKAKNWWTGGGWNTDSEAEKIRVVRTVEGYDPLVPEHLRGPERFVDYNKAGEIVGIRDVRGIQDNSAILLSAAGGLGLVKRGLKVGRRTLGRHIKPKVVSNPELQVGEYTYTRTVGNHLGDMVKKGEHAGRLARPYMRSPSLINEIQAAGRGVPDPGGIPGALRYDVPGYFRGNQGTWELVVHSKTKTIYHFNFVN